MRRLGWAILGLVLGLVTLAVVYWQPLGREMERWFQRQLPGGRLWQRLEDRLQPPKPKPEGKPSPPDAGRPDTRKLRDRLLDRLRERLTEGADRENSPDNKAD